MDNRIEIGQEELKRLMIIEDVNRGFMTQKAASALLGISTRQIRRLQNRVKTEGYSGIKSRKIGGNRSISLEQKAKILSIVESKYYDFGPTFAAEKLNEEA